MKITKNDFYKIKEQEIIDFKQTWLYSRSNSIWNSYKCNDPKLIGYCVKMCRANKCFNYDSFLSVWMSSIPEKNLEQCLVRLACGLKDNGINFKSRDLMMILLGRVVYETIQGIINEDLVYKMLNELGSIKNVRKTSEKEDEEGGVDYIVTLHNEKKISIQVKPLSWVLQVIQHDGSYRSLVEKIKSFNKSNFIEEWVIIFVDKGRVCDTSIDNLYKRIYKLCVGGE